MQTISEITFEELEGFHGDIGLITLTRQQALNALNHTMFIALKEQLKMWGQQKNIKAVIIRAAEGRAFCAGGDIRHAYQLKLANDPTLPDFFRDEYEMNSYIHHFPKPYIALLNGITMGGGAGISIHGSHRVGTKNLVFAMPETGIGFYPDVGTTYYLARFPHKIGIYLGLTGVKISYADCLALGIVQEIVEPESLDQIVSALRETIITDNNSVTKILKLFSTPVSHSELLQHQQEIEACFAKNTVEDIIKTLENYGSEWCQQTAKLLSTKSPTSLKVTLMALQKASHLTFDECMQMEYGLTCHFIKKHDFFEGIRAVIIDKDQNPHWHPITLQQTTEQEIEEYFVLQSAEKNHTHVPGAGSDKQHPETPPDANERFREGEQEGK